MAKVMVYSTMAYSVDVANQESAARADRARSTAAQLGSAAAFAIPEMLQIALPKLRGWVGTAPRPPHLGRSFHPLEPPPKAPRPAGLGRPITAAGEPPGAA